MQGHYSYRVSWSPEDRELVGTCAEFPSLSWLAPTQPKALAGIMVVVRDAVADMKANGETPPVAIAEMPASGSFMVGVPPEVHRRLKIRAAEAKVSVNRLVSSVLAASD